VATAIPNNKDKKLYFSVFLVNDTNISNVIFGKMRIFVALNSLTLTSMPL
jgi:hypothetical protein